MILDDNVLSSPLNEFGVQVCVGLFHLEHLVPELSEMLSKVSDEADYMADNIDSISEIESLLPKGRQLLNGKSRTVEQIQRMAQSGHPDGLAMVAVLAKELVKGFVGIREAHAAIFPQLVWSSVVVSSMSQLEVALRSYIAYLSFHLQVQVETNEDSYRNAFEEFLRFVRHADKLHFDFGASKHWNAMKYHNKVRNLIVHWGGSLVGRKGLMVRNHPNREEMGLNIRDNMLHCTDVYATCVIKTAQNFLISFDEAAREQLPELW